MRRLWSRIGAVDRHGTDMNETLDARASCCIDEIARCFRRNVIVRMRQMNHSVAPLQRFGDRLRIQKVALNNFQERTGNCPRLVRGSSEYPDPLFSGPLQPRAEPAADEAGGSCNQAQLWVPIG